MKQLCSFFLFLLSMGLLFSCEDEIDQELEEADPKIVVDAWLNNLDEEQIIRLTYSQPLTNTDQPLTIDDAEIIITNGDLSINTQAIGDGQYKLEDHDFGPVGTEYTLSISLPNGNRYQSTTQMEDAPVIDSIVSEFREDEIFGPDGYYAQFFARDLPGLGNTYWIKTYKNGMFLNDPFEINIAYDAAFDAGGMIDNFVFITPIRELINPILTDEQIEDEIAPYAIGDHIRVEIHSISNAAFDFMTVARDQLQNGNNGIFASPIANTVGNVEALDTDEVVLGIFNVAKVNSMEITVEE
jgi:hypothetical protein